MYDITTVKTAFRNLIGWRGSLDADMPVLSSALKTSNSGLYFEDAHPLVTLENIDSTFANIDGNMYANYSPTTSYAIGTIVRSSSITYISLTAANKGNTPETSPTNWSPLINTIIQNIGDNAVVNMLERFLNERKLQNASKSLLDDLRLFDGEGRVTSSVIAQSRFVGFEVKVRNYSGLVASIRKISGQFTATQSGLTIYLFHSSQKTAVATYVMTTTKAYSAEWFTPVAFDMNFCKYAYNDAGGAWYVGYFEDSLTGQAINRDIDFLTEPCRDCWKDEYNHLSWELRNRYVSIMPCCFANDYLDGVNCPDMKGLSYLSNCNFGLNLAITAHCDLTDFFVDNKTIFTRVLWKQVAYDIIKQIAFSTRIDGLKETLRGDAYAELKGDPGKAYRNGIEHELNNEYKAINFTVDDLNSPCMNKTGNRGLKLGAI